MKLSNKQINALRFIDGFFTHQNEAVKKCGKATLRSLVNKGLVAHATLHSNFGYKLTAAGADIHSVDREMRQLADPSLSPMVK